jgi:NADH:ubiquinone oxidoreductase subunit 5 (subunit L)/multisubunit Na+/H+ antiporter MnhA subunit
MSALPPLNGFISEWLLYRALARVAVHGAGGPGLAAIAGAGALALIGGLGALCFVRLIGVVLLGTPRAQEAAVAHESPRAMLAPMMLLAGACVASAFAAPVLVSIQTPLLVRLAGASAADVNAAMQLLSPVLVVNAVLFAAITLMALFFRSRAALRRAQLRETWGCGYANPSARMQYTGGAFSELLSAGVLPRWLRGQQRLHAPAGLFPPAASFSSYASDPMTQLIYEPFLARWAQRFVRLRVLQQGNVQVYILYVVAAAVLGFAWIVCRDWLLQ